MHAYYQFFDRAAAGELLAMPWKAILQRHPRSRRSIEELLAFALDNEPDDRAMERILATRTVRWTMKRSSPQYHFLAEVLYATWGHPCRHRYADCDPAATPVLLAAAVNGFLAGKLRRSVLHAILKLNAIGFATDWISLTRVEQRLVSQGWDPAQMASPIYPWQGSAAHLDDGDTGLGAADTRRLLSFLRTAWQENWATPRLNADTLKLRTSGSIGPPRFRDFSLTHELHRVMRGWSPTQPAVFRREE